MLNNNSGLVNSILSILLFPTFFQEAFIGFAWGSEDSWLFAIGKRLFFLLPVLAIILGCWLSVACVLSVLVRQNRREFVTHLFVTWWDLAKAIGTFWGGILKFVFLLFAAILNAIKFALFAFWSLLQEIVLMPFRLLGTAGRNVVRSSIPWIAVSLTLFWCLIEAMIFTYVTSALVVDTFSNITGESLSENAVRIPLFVFLLFIVLGSYAVLSTFVSAVNKKSLSTIIGIGAIEIVVLFVEVVFLYREFVDSLVPWFAQHSENFELGILGTLAISCFVWFGIRSLSWFLFASHGTPTIMAVIQGKGLTLAKREEHPKAPYRSVSSDFMEKIKSDMAWMQKTGETLLTAFVLPPMQVVAGALNFCTLLISGDHLFELPLTDLDGLKQTHSAFRPEMKTTGVKANGSFPKVKEEAGDYQNV